MPAAKDPEKERARREKISKALTGRKKPDLSKRMMGEGNPNFGKYPTALMEWCKHHRGEKHPCYGRTGKKHPMFGKKRPEHAEMMRGKGNPNFGKRGKETSQFGNTREKNGNWQGGVSFEPYTAEFNDELKESIRRRDGYHCQKCNCSELEEGIKLACHHIDYNKKNNNRNNLVSLCNGCNGKVNKNRKKWTRYFQKKLAIGYEQKQLCLARL